MTEEKTVFTVLVARHAGEHVWLTTYGIGGNDAEYIVVDTESEQDPVLILQDSDENPIAAFRFWDAVFKDGVLLEERSEILRAFDRDHRADDAKTEAEEASSVDDDVIEGLRPDVF